MKDPTNAAFSRNADIYYAAVRCPKCKHVTKVLISKRKTEIIKCHNCKEDINLKDTNVRDIMGFNRKFVAQVKKLDAIEYTSC